MNQENDGLARKLTFFTATAIVIGAVIGSGIFKKPAYMADALGGPELMLIVWIIAGIVTYFGAITNAEVAGLLPKTGGQFIYFREMYGDLTAFLYGWAMFSVVQCGSIASITWVFSEYFEYFITLPRFPAGVEQSVTLFLPGIGTIYPLADFGVKSLTIIVLWFLTIVNYFGVKNGGRISEIFTSAKIVAIACLIIFCFVFADGSAANFTKDDPNFTYGTAGLIGAVIAALSAAFWAYDGWNNITYLAGEVKEPQKNIPRALAVGLVVVVGVYILINLAFLYVLPVSEMANSELVASDAARKAIGYTGGAIVAAFVMISTFGTSNGTIMASARLYYAMSKKNLFFRRLQKTHPRFKTPANSLLLQGTWASVLVISGSFDNLTDMLIFVSWVFYALGAYGLFILRKKMPDAERPYKVWGYPVVPIVFIIFACVFVIITLYNDIGNYYSGKSEIINSLFGIFLVSLGLPFYFAFKRKIKRSSENKK